MAFTADGWRPDLPQIDLIWHGTSDDSARFQSVTTTQCELVVAKLPGRPIAVAVRGPETRVTTAAMTAGGEWWGIQFAVGTFLPQLPARALVDNSIELLDPGSRSVRWPGGWIPVPELDDAEAFVRRLVRDNLLDYDPVVAVALRDDAAADRSRRTVQRRVRQATGLSPVTIRQIQRANRALDLLREGHSILETVHEIGYFDQAHLTHSLKRWLGQTPAQVARAEVRLSR